MESATMCGICGIVYRRPERHPTEPLLKRMSDTIRHRGPDDEGAKVLGQVGLGHRRLSIIDLSSMGHQPMSNEDGTVWIVFNGEIYNFRQLREGLNEQHRFRSQTDSEVLIHLYEEHGPRMVDLLDGMFALVIYDQNSQTIFAARDPFGIKPLYYSLDESRFVFGSELKPLLASGEVGRDIDLRALNDYFDFFWIPAPRSIFKGVNKLPAAHTLSLDLPTWTWKVNRYWLPEYNPQLNRTSQQWTEEVEAGLSTSVRRQLVSDVPLGSFLSGGIDSTLVTYFAHKNTSASLKTFTIDFRDSSASEADKARVVTDQLKTQSVYRTLSHQSIENLSALSEFYDEPFADSSMLPTSLVSRVARDDVKVVLSGDGGDELFTGYRHHAMAAKLSRLDRIPSPLSFGLFGAVAACAPAGTRARDWARRFALSPDARRLSIMRLPGRGQRTDVLAPGIREPRKDRFWHMDEHLDLLRGLPPITQVQIYDMLMYLPSDMLVKVDRASMAYGLETRVPFLSRELAELALRVPEEIRFDAKIQKPILRRIVADKFGDKLAYSPKHGFAIPRTRWMTDAATEETEQSILQSSAVRNGILDKNAIQSLFTHVRRGANRWRGDRTEEVFSVLSFKAWWDRYMSGVG